MNAGHTIPLKSTDTSCVGNPTRQHEGPGDAISVALVMSDLNPVPTVPVGEAQHIGILALMMITGLGEEKGDDDHAQRR